jgi:hypothetical protein
MERNRRSESDIHKNEAVDVVEETRNKLGVEVRVASEYKVS